jgi:hypothetical protein
MPKMNDLTETYGTDWLAIEEVMRDLPEEQRTTIAHEFIAYWRENQDEPGFNQPGGNLVEYVEALTDEAAFAHAH